MGRHKVSNLKEKEAIIIATIKSWNICSAERFKDIYKERYNISIFTQKEELTYKNIERIAPKYIFFPHWSWIIPPRIYQNFNCVVFHMTDLPYGRGGSPLQNLITNKVYDTKISAIKVDSGMDTGKIYMKEDFHIGLGSAEEIFQKASDLIFSKIIPYILDNNPIPYEQKGEVVEFKRRTPDESNILNANIVSLADLYDFIRMLDGEGYPKAFLKIGDLRFLFSEVHKKADRLVGRFEVIGEEQ